MGWLSGLTRGRWRRRVGIGRERVEVRRWHLTEDAMERSEAAGVEMLELEAQVPAIFGDRDLPDNGRGDVEEQLARLSDRNEGNGRP